MRWIPIVIVMLACPAVLLPGCGGGDSGTTDPQGPTVSWTAPTDGTIVSGSVTLSADAERADRVRFEVDGTAIATDDSAPYSVAWNTGDVEDGSHTLRAVAEGAGSTAEASISVTVENAVGGLDPEEVRLLGQTFSAGTDAGILVGELVDGGVEAVFVASILNGGTLTVTGTLTQSSVNPDSFSYSATPEDRLVILLGTGTRFEVVVHAFEGFLDGEWEDFRDFHNNLDFEVSLADQIDVRIRSASGNPGKPAAPAGFTEFQRTIEGTYVFETIPLTLDITQQGSRFFEISGTSSELDTQEAVFGTVTSPDGVITMDTTYRYRSLLVTNFVENVTRGIASRAERNGVVYEFVGGFVRSAFSNNRVTDAEFWAAEGTLRRDGESIGGVRFDRPVTEGTTFDLRPRPELALGTGEVIPLRPGKRNPLH